ncbi:tyrosine-type recombinase/integrase [Streptococcus sp. H49]|uniref:tyrosine-type recombinase/integrase n=1 Tax=Streptococcus huangxiaojuni TaxID=3237239 RepID=UPI0034A11D9B
MFNDISTDTLFHAYFKYWISLFKEGAVRSVTLEKYYNNQKHLQKIVPNLALKELNRTTYQQLLNDYAENHEKQTVIDFHHQIKGAVLDAVDEGFIERDPTRKVIFKGKTPRKKKIKFLNQYELHKLLEDLDLSPNLSWDWLILLIAKTGLRFSEALGLTPKDFDFVHQTISVNKTWDYKKNTGFQATKNKSSNRKIQIDWQIGAQFQQLIKDLPVEQPIFATESVCNSTPNQWLMRHCQKVNIPVISIHGFSKNTLTSIIE